jgi:hypothetical protein
MVMRLPWEQVSGRSSRLIPTCGGVMEPANHADCESVTDGGSTRTPHLPVLADLGFDFLKRVTRFDYARGDELPVDALGAQPHCR